MTPQGLETVFLDAGGVLVNPNWHRVSAALRAQAVEVTAETLEAAEPRAKKQLDTETRVNATSDASRGWLYFDLVLDEAGIPHSEATHRALQELAAYHRETNLWESVPEDVPAALGRLRSAGLRLVVVSNANGTARQLFARVGLLDRVDFFLDSQEEGVEKPDPRFFELALARSGARAETTLHVGDLYHVDVRGARAAGIEAWLFDVAGLYPDADCPRVASLTELADALTGSSASRTSAPR